MRAGLFRIWGGRRKFGVKGVLWRGRAPAGGNGGRGGGVGGSGGYSGRCFFGGGEQQRADLTHQEDAFIAANDRRLMANWTAARPLLEAAWQDALILLWLLIVGTELEPAEGSHGLRGQMPAVEGNPFSA